MKKIFFLLTFFISVSYVYSALNEVKLYRNNSYISKIKTYKFNDRIYFDSSEIINKIGGKTYWYPVSYKLVIQLKSHKIIIDRKNDYVKFDDDEEENLPNVLIVRGGKVFLSKDLFLSKLFSKTVGFRVESDEKENIIRIVDNINITSFRYFSYKDKTRLVIYLDSPLEFKTTQIEKKNFILSIINGSYSATDEKVAVNDGVINSVEFNQEDKSARFVINLGENFKDLEVFTLKEPDRIVIDFKAEEDKVLNRINEEPVKLIPPSSSTQALSVSTLTVVLPDKIGIRESGIKKIVIDPGHGGKDPGGKIIFGMKEKDINLSVARELYSLLKKEKKFDVILTRNKDEFIALNERSKIANDFGADIFISIHANASKNKKEKGFEIYFLSEKATDPWSAEVADYENAVVSFENDNFDYSPAAIVLHSLARNEYINEGSKIAAYISKEYERNTPFINRGIKQAAFYVLRGTYAPGVLIEMGFMTNSQDQKKLSDHSVHKKIAKAIYEGILKYAKSKGW